MRASTSIGARAYGKIDADHQAQLQAKRQARRRVGIIVACSLLLLAAIVAVTVGVIISKRNSSGHGDGDDDSSSSSTAQLSTGVKAIQTACNATSYPDLCVETLTNSSEALSADPLHLVIIASQLALRGVRQAYNLSVSLISGHGYSSPLEHAAIEDCSELLDLAADEIEDSIARLESLDLTSFAKALRNVEIVLSTASSLQAGCSDGLVNITGTAAMQLGAKQEDVDKLIIIALGLVEALASLGSSLSSWKSSLPSNATGSLPFGLHFRRRRLLLLSSDSSSSEAADANDGFPDWVTPMGRRILQSSADSSTNSSASSTNSTTSSTNSTSSSSNSTASSTWDAVVGPGETFTTIAQALASVPSSDSYPSGERYTIYIKSGTYDEGPLNVSKALVNLTLLGDGCGKTIVRGFASVSGANNTLGGLSVTTYRSATLGIVAKGFIAKGITFANAAGPQGHQAVALRASADYFVFHECCFEGYQDTLYAHAGRQFYRDCTISGTVDFIFGDSLAVFQNCELRARVPMAGQQNTITAQGKKQKDTVTGFSFQNCSLTAESGLNSSTAATFLGRPWKTYSTTVFLRSAIGAHIDPSGWLSWNASNPFETTCVYGEYANTGAGANTSRRVNWPCVKPAMSASQAAAFSVSALLPDTSFIPASVPLDASV